MNKPWKVILVFVGVFLAGGFCGAAFTMRWFHGPPPGTRGPVKFDLMQRLDEKLELTDAQKEKIRPIVQRTQQETQRLRRENVREIAAVMDRMHADIAAELTPGQKVKLDEMRKRFRERAERVRGILRERQMPPPPDEKST